jgi:predicted esterase
MATSTSDIHVIAPTTAHTHTTIFLHGSGSNAREFESEFFESQASDDRFLADIFPGLKWVFPCAQVRHAETEQEDMHQWFDMASVREPRTREELQLPGLRESVGFIKDIMEEEAEKMGGMHAIFLGGISQGCATALVALLTSRERIAGFVGMSSWLPFPSPVHSRVSWKEVFLQWVQERLLPASTESIPFQSLDTVVRTPVLLEHAEDDKVVPVGNGKELSEGLRALGMKVEWQQYVDGAHWVNEPKGIDDMVRFIATCCTSTENQEA